MSFKKKVGVSKSKETYEKYTWTCLRIEDFVKSKYNLSDIPLREVNHKFIADLEAYLRVDCDLNVQRKVFQINWKDAGEYSFVF